MKLALILLAVLLLLLILRRQLGWLVRLMIRSGVGLAFLWLFRGIGSLIGVSLGVNLFNSVVLGALGIPGFGLLLMSQWLLR